jgi:branched-chain amino acid transport system substrate-binding protein
MWVRFINAAGGLRGHPVTLIVYDDGGDPARHRAQVQEAVEQRKAVAFLMNGEALTGQGSVDYINRKRVPIIGQTSGEGNWVYESPMYFPQASNAEPLARSLAPAFARQLVPKGKAKLATLVCVEAGGCNDFDRIVAEEAPRVGFQHVYRGRGSIAQPDYTAECLAARNAEAQVFFVALDQNSVGRVATACGRQGYRPTFALYGPAVLEAQKDDPNLAGAVAMSNVVPYFQTGTPATDEYQAALKAFGQGVSRGIQGPVVGWVAGKLLERAGAQLSEPPTSESILSGLWAIQADTLGGMTQPLTFRKDQPAEPKGCWFDMAIDNGRWTSPDNSALHCL